MGVDAPGGGGKFIPGGGVTAEKLDVADRGAGGAASDPGAGSAPAPFLSPRRAFRSLISLLCGRFCSDNGNLLKPGLYGSRLCDVKVSTQA
jgi:hypothetical protein